MEVAVLKDEIVKEHVEDENVKERYCRMYDKMIDSLYKKKIYIDIKDLCVLSSEKLPHGERFEMSSNIDEYDFSPIKTLIDDKGVYGLIIFKKYLAKLIFRVALFRQDVIYYVGLDIFDKNIFFINNSLAMQKVNAKIISNLEERNLRLISDLILKHLKNKGEKLVSKIAMRQRFSISKKYAYKEYNSIICKELNICNQKYLTACRKFPMHIRQRVYLCSCIFGERFYELTYSCPVLAYYIAYSLDFRYIHKVGSEKLKNVMELYNIPYCARKLTTADCNYFINRRMFHLFRMKKFQDIFNNYFPHDNKRLSKIFMKMLNNIVCHISMSDEHGNELHKRRNSLSNKVIKLNDDISHYKYDELVITHNFDLHYVELGTDGCHSVNFYSYLYSLNVKENDNSDLISMIKWYAKNFKSIINYNKNVANRKLSSSLVLNDIMDFLLANNRDDNQINLYSYIDCNFNNVLYMERQWAQQNASKSSPVSDDTVFPEPNFGLWEYKKWTIEPIKNQKDLIEEAFEMRHCVNSYGEKVLRGESYIYSMKNDGKRVATIELSRKRIVQVRGHSNSDVDEKANFVINKWRKFLNS